MHLLRQRRHRPQVHVASHTKNAPGRVAVHAQQLRQLLPQRRRAPAAHRARAHGRRQASMRLLQRLDHHQKSEVARREFAPGRGHRVQRRNKLLQFFPQPGEQKRAHQKCALCGENKTTAFLHTLQQKVCKSRFLKKPYEKVAPRGR